MAAKHTAADGLAETVSTMAAIKPMRKPPTIGPGRMQGVVNWEYDVTISDDAIFDSKIITTVTWNNSAVDEWISNVYFGHSKLRCRLIVGLTAWCSPPYDGPFGVISLCAGRRCLIYQISLAKRGPSGMAASLANFVSDQNNQFVGVGVEAILRNLRRDYGIGEKVRVWDLREAAAVRYRQPDLGKAWLRRLAQVVIKTDFHLEEGAAVNEEWEAFRLTPWQVLSATVAAYLSYEIGWTLYTFDRISHAFRVHNQGS